MLVKGVSTNAKTDIETIKKSTLNLWDINNIGAFILYYIIKMLVNQVFSNISQLYER